MFWAALKYFGLYLAAWLVAFFIVVGTDVSLAPKYFALGWTFSGLELVSFQWLLSLVLFGLIVIASTGYRLWRRKRSVPFA